VSLPELRGLMGSLWTSAMTGIGRSGSATLIWQRSSRRDRKFAVPDSPGRVSPEHSKKTVTHVPGFVPGLKCCQ
jgi:hypothetical protein